MIASKENAFNWTLNGMLRLPLLSLILFSFLSAYNAQASEISFLSKKVDLVGQSGPFLVVKTNVNVRQNPQNKSKRITKLNRRDIVLVLGKVKGKNWYAVKRDGEDLGYVYGTSLTPLLNGEIEKPLIGKIDLSQQDKPNCAYEIKYSGRTSEEDIVFISSDYLANFTCSHESEIFQFDANLFLAEIPFDLGGDPVFQIAFDLPDIATGYEEFLSIIVSFDAQDQKVKFEQVSLNKYEEKTPIRELPASTAVEALEAAAKIQLSALNTTAWKTISGKIKPPSEPTQ